MNKGVPETPETLESVEHHTPAFAMVPEWAIFSRRLTNTQYRVYTALCLYANKYDQAWPRVETLAEKAGITHQAVSKTIRELAKLGLVAITKAGFPAHNRYRVYRGSQPPPGWADDAASCNLQLQQLQPVVAEVATSEVAEEQTNRTDQKNIVSHECSFTTSLAPRAPAAREGVSPAFDETALRRDPLTLTLIACLGHEPSTRREWGQWRLAVNDLHAAHVQADDIPRAIRGYQATYPKARITPLALVNHWSEIQEGKPHDLAQLEIARRATAAENERRREQERLDRERRAREADEVERYMREHGYGARA